MNKKNKEQTELSYYGLYLLNNLQENKFEQASDRAFIKDQPTIHRDIHKIFNRLIVRVIDIL